MRTTRWSPGVAPADVAKRLQVTAEENMRALGLIILVALAGCAVPQQRAVTVPPGTCLADIQDGPFFHSGLRSLNNRQIAERNTQRRAYARAHQSPNCPAEAALPSSANRVEPHAEGVSAPVYDDSVAMAIQQANTQNWLAQQQDNFWQMQNWQAQQQNNFWTMVGATR